MSYTSFENPSSYQNTPTFTIPSYNSNGDFNTQNKN